MSRRGLCDGNNMHGVLETLFLYQMSCYLFSHGGWFLARRERGSRFCVMVLCICGGVLVYGSMSSRLLLRVLLVLRHLEIES